MLVRTAGCRWFEMLLFLALEPDGDAGDEWMKKVNTMALCIIFVVCVFFIVYWYECWLPWASENPLINNVRYFHSSSKTQLYQTHETHERFIYFDSTFDAMRTIRCNVRISSLLFVLTMALYTPEKSNGIWCEWKSLVVFVYISYYDKLLAKDTAIL